MSILLHKPDSTRHDSVQCRRLGHQERLRRNASVPAGTNTI